MASQFDLAPRLAALQGAGFNITSEYKGTPAAWLTTALNDCDVHVVNCKGTKLNDVLCMVRLSQLEKLVRDVGATPESVAAISHSQYQQG